MTGPGTPRASSHVVRYIGVLVVLAAACRGLPPQVAAPARPEASTVTAHPVGITTRVLDDHARGRRLAVTIWYPAVPGAVERTTYWDGIFPGRGAWEAPLRGSPRRLPLVLLSHGSGGDGSNLAWLAEALAARGWVAAAVDHPGDRFGDWSPEGRFAVWRRAPDVSIALTGLLHDNALGPRIDRRRIAAAGHSSGGTTALLLAGVRLRPADFVAACSVPEPAPECGFLGEVDVAATPDLVAAGDALRDRRVRAVVALAPVFGVAATPTSARTVAVPVAIAGSPSDEHVAFDGNAGRYARLVPRARLTTIPGAGHFIFMPVCTTPGRLVAAAVCVDGTDSPDRAAVHEQTSAIVTRFLDGAFASR